MLTWTLKEAEKDLLTLFASAALGNVQKIDFDNMKSVYVLSENYFQTLVTKAKNLDSQNELEQLNPNQLNLIS